METPVEESNLATIARRIRADIQTHQLREGARYRTASDIGKLLDISPTMAHRAMSLLVQAQVLVRKQGSGTYIGPAATAHQSNHTLTYIFLPQESHILSNLRLDLLVETLRKKASPAGTQICFIPADHPVQFVEEMLEGPRAAGHLGGVVAISCPHVVYQYLEESGVRLAVLGTLYANQKRIFSIDIDHKAAGYALTSQLISHGHKRIALFATTNWRPGDNAFYDGVNDALTRSGMPPNTIVMRLFPDAMESFRAQTNELLTADDRPTAIICATQYHIPAIVDLAKPLGLTIGRDLELTYHGLTPFPDHSIPLISAVPEYSFDGIAVKLAELLLLQQNGSVPADRQTRIPVKLILPRRSAQ